LELVGFEQIKTKTSAAAGKNRISKMTATFKEKKPEKTNSEKIKHNRNLFTKLLIRHCHIIRFQLLILGLLLKILNWAHTACPIERKNTGNRLNF